jgi:hypothetical protein
MAGYISVMTPRPVSGHIQLIITYKNIHVRPFNCSQQIIAIIHMRGRMGAATLCPVSIEAGTGSSHH